MAGVLSSRGCTMVIVDLIDSVECLDEVVFRFQFARKQIFSKGSLDLSLCLQRKFFPVFCLIFFGDFVHL